MRDDRPAERRYYPWGAERYVEAAVPTARLYTGQIQDGTGLYYYNARYYDPYIQRWISPDTIVPGMANPQAFNRYSYVLNRPLRYTDPTGHFSPEELAQYLATYICNGDPNCTYDGSVEALYASALWQDWLTNNPEWIIVLLAAREGDITSFGWPRGEADWNLPEDEKPCYGIGQFQVTENGTLIVLQESADSFVDRAPIECPALPDLEQGFKAISDLTYWEFGFRDAVDRGAFAALGRRADSLDANATIIRRWNPYLYRSCPRGCGPWGENRDTVCARPFVEQLTITSLPHGPFVELRGGVRR